MSFCKVFLYGNVGRDPEVRNTANGGVQCNFSVATTRKSKNGDQTSWHDVTVFGRTAEFVQNYVKRGSAVVVDGDLTSRKSEKNGNTYWNIIANSVQLLGKSEKQDQKEPSFNDDGFGDNPQDIPF